MFGQRSRVDAESAGPLDQYVFEGFDLDGVPAGHHRRKRAVRRRDLLVGQLIRNTDHACARRDVAVLGKPADEMGRFGAAVVTVLFQMAALHHQALFPAVITFPAVVHDGPGDAIPHPQGAIPRIHGDARAEFDNPADNFVTQDDRNRRFSTARPGVKIRAADRAAGNPDQDAPGKDFRERIVPNFQLFLGLRHDGGPSCSCLHAHLPCPSAMGRSLKKDWKSPFTMHSRTAFTCRQARCAFTRTTGHPKTTLGSHSAICGKR